MNKVEAAEYEKTVSQLLRCLVKYERKLFKLKQKSFTNNEMVSRFYKCAELDLREAQNHIKHGYNLHTHYIVDNKEKQNIITSNRYEREKSN